MAAIRAQLWLHEDHPGSHNYRFSSHHITSSLTHYDSETLIPGPSNFGPKKSPTDKDSNFWGKCYNFEGYITGVLELDAIYWDLAGSLLYNTLNGLVVAKSV